MVATPEPCPICGRANCYAWQVTRAAGRGVPGCALPESDSRPQRADGVHDDNVYGGAMVVCYCFTALLAYVAGVLTAPGWQWAWRWAWS